MVDGDNDFHPLGSASASSSDAARKFSNLSIEDSRGVADPRLEREDSADFRAASQVALPAGEKKAPLASSSFDLGSTVDAKLIKGAAVECLNDGSRYDAMGSRHHIDAVS